MNPSFAIVITLANESNDFEVFIKRLTNAIASYANCTVWLITDGASKDDTPNLCAKLAKANNLFNHYHSTDLKNMVAAKMKGFELAATNKPEYILELDAGLSHRPEEIKDFVAFFNKNYECIYGSRFCKGGFMDHNSWVRKFFSKGGTIISNLLLGTKLKDMTSGFQAFSLPVVEKMISYPFISIAHFHQTEMRYLLRKYKSIEVPIHYTAPSPNVSKKSVWNSIYGLWYYFYKRITGKAISL
jgi:dolichol-phosphate mannosyltransferase